MDWFEDVYKSYYGHVYKYIYILCMDNNIIEDIAQDVFTLCYRKRNNLPDHPCIKGWLYTTAFNKTMEYLRKRNKKIKYEFELSPQALIDVYHIDTVPSSLSYEILNYILSEEEINILKEHIEYGFTVKELAEIKGVKYSAFRQRVLRFKKKAREILRGGGMNEC